MDTQEKRGMRTRISLLSYHTIILMKKMVIFQKHDTLIFKHKITVCIS